MPRASGACRTRGHPWRCSLEGRPLSRLRELAGRSRSEDGLEAELGADWSPDSDCGWDWDAEWAATQTGTPQDSPVDDAATPDRDTAAAADDDLTAPRPARRVRLPLPALRRPPRHRAPLLLAVAVVGAVLAGALGGFGGHDANPAASGMDYGLGSADASFSGGVDVTGARGEISQAEAEARISEIAASRAAREPDFVVPTDGQLTTCFCTRWGSMHWGIDLAAPLGTPIYAAADGVVLRAGPATGYGNAVYIQDADGNVEIYGHMKYYNVAAGDVVSAGEQIAKVGNQGQSTGPHLHFEIHVGGINGKPTDPQKWLADRGLQVG